MHATMEALRETHATAPIRVFIVDSHELLRVGLRTTIANESDLTVCGEAADMSGALEQIQALQPHVAIIDIALQTGDGLELVKRIRDHAPNVRMIVSSMYTEELYGERALRAGATGYVCKQEPLRAILSCIREVYHGKPHFSADLIQRMMHRERSRGDGAARSPIETLSDRELEVFRRIGQGLPTIEIAGQLNLSRSTIDTYRERLKTKLGLANGSELTRQATLWVAHNPLTALTRQTAREHESG